MMKNRTCLVYIWLSIYSFQIYGSTIDVKISKLKTDVESIADMMRDVKFVCSTFHTVHRKDGVYEVRTPQPLFVIFGNKERVSLLQKAIMAGLFIDAFGDPLEASYVVGLAAKIYGLLFDEQHHKKALGAYLPADCNAENPKLDKPYDDLKTWAREQFSTNNLLNQTVKDVLNSAFQYDTLASLIQGAERIEAENFWGIVASVPTAQSGKSALIKTSPDGKSHTK